MRERVLVQAGVIGSPDWQPGPDEGGAEGKHV